MKENGLKHLYVEELKDLFSAENQLLKALPKMAKASKSASFVVTELHYRAVIFRKGRTR
jgi:ferritin-like metal-binding protein YciE